MELPRVLNPKTHDEATTLLSPLKRLPRLDAEDSAERAKAMVFYGAALMLFATILRFAGMAAEPFWHDEITMLNIGLGGWDEFIYQFNTGRPPLFVFISFVWTALFGTGEVVSRIPSLAASVLSVGVLFYLGSVMFNQRVGFLAALVMTVTEFHIYYAQTYRYYAVYVLMVLLSYLFFYMILKRGRWYDTVLYLVFTPLALFAHAHGVFVVASQVIFIGAMLLVYPQWRTRRFIGRWIGIQAVLGLLILPGLWQYYIADFLATSSMFTGVAVAAADGEVSLGWLAEPSIGSIVRALVRFLWYEWYYFNPYGVFTALLFIVAGTAYFVSRVGGRTWLKSVLELPRDLIASQPNHLPEWGLVLSWFVGMLMLPWVLSFIVTPMFFDRYVLGASPAYYLFLILILFGIRRVIPVQVLIIAFLVSLIPGLFAFYAYPDNEQWPDLSNYVSANLQSGDAIVVLTNDVHLGQPLESFNWYYPGSATCELHDDKLDQPSTTEALSECLAGHDRIWLVGLRWMGDYERLSADGISSTLTELFASDEVGNWELVESWDGQPFYLLGLYLYERNLESAEAVWHHARY